MEPLQRICHHCKMRNPAKAKFCQECGTALVPVAAKNPPARGAAPPFVKEVVGEIPKAVAGWIVASAIPAVILSVTGGRSVPEWLLLTWPLTAAAAAYVVIAARFFGPNDVAANLATALILLVGAAVLASVFSGVQFDVPSSFSPGFYGSAFISHILGEFQEAYGVGAFALSIATGFAIGIYLHKQYPPGAPPIA
jgi:hypothetical protein